MSVMTNMSVDVTAWGRFKLGAALRLAWLSQDTRVTHYIIDPPTEDSGPLLVLLTSNQPRAFESPFGEMDLDAAHSFAWSWLATAYGEKPELANAHAGNAWHAFVDEGHKADGHESVLIAIEPEWGVYLNGVEGVQ